MKTLRLSAVLALLFFGFTPASQAVLITWRCDFMGSWWGWGEFETPYFLHGSFNADIDSDRHLSNIQPVFAAFNTLVRSPVDEFRIAETFLLDPYKVYGTVRLPYNGSGPLNDFHFHAGPDRAIIEFFRDDLIAGPVVRWNVRVPESAPGIALLSVLLALAATVRATSRGL